jgi:hypothetical protein
MHILYCMSYVQYSVHNYDKVLHTVFLTPNPSVRVAEIYRLIIWIQPVYDQLGGAVCTYIVHLIFLPPEVVLYIFSCISLSKGMGTGDEAGGGGDGGGAGGGGWKWGGGVG